MTKLKRWLKRIFLGKRRAVMLPGFVGKELWEKRMGPNLLVEASKREAGKELTLHWCEEDD